MNKLFLRCMKHKLYISVVIMWLLGGTIAVLQFVEVILQSELLNDKSSELQTLMNKLIIIIICFFLYILLKSIFDWSIQIVAAKFSKGIRVILGEQLNQMQYAKLEQYDGGTIYSMVTSDPQIISEWYQCLLRLGSVIIQIAITSTCCLILSLPITLLMFPSGAIAVLVPSLFYKNLYQYHKTEKTTENTMNSKLVQAIKFLPTVKAYCLENQFICENHQVLLNNGDIRKRISAQTEKGLRAGIMFGHLITASLLVLGAYLILGTKLTLGELYALILLYSLTGDGITQLIQILPKHKSCITSMERVNQFLSQEIYDTTTLDNSNQWLPSDEQLEAYSIMNVHYSYLGEKEILHGINCRINRGEKIAIVGPSGSGKTTLFKLLSGLYPLGSENGAIRLIGCDMNTESIPMLRRNVSVMSQDTILLEDSIFHNITMYKEIDKEEVYSLCKRLGLHEVILALEDGYETKVTPLYNKLSRGQIQRIGLARVLLQNREILLLDEPLSALDQETGELIYQMIMSEAKEKTIIMICHKLIHPNDYSRIMVVNEGEVLGFESHNNLERECEFYQRMVEHGLISEA